MNRATPFAAVAFIMLCAGCSGSPSSPSPNAVATFAVANERFSRVVDQRRADRRGPCRPVWRPRANPYWSNRLRHAGQYRLELASRGCHIRGKHDRTVRWPAIGRGATGDQLRRRALLSVGCDDTRNRLSVRSGCQTGDSGVDPDRPAPRVRSSRGTTMNHSHSPDTERRIREAALDETLAATFPASDAPSTLPNPDDDSVDAVSSTNEQDSKMPPSALT